MTELADLERRLRTIEEFAVSRAGANHFRLRRSGGRWVIVARRTRQLDGNAEARELLAAGVAGRS